MDEPRHGAYGFRLRCADFGGALNDLVALAVTTPVVEIAVRHACVATTFDTSNAASAAMGQRGGSAFHVTRTPPRIVFDLPEAPSPDVLIHPLATVPLAVLARWRGDVTLHGGAFAALGRAWVVLGTRYAGKSTMLAVAARRGYPVLADDLIGVKDGTVLAGPRCIDLREDAAQRLAPVRDLGDLGSRRRYRLTGPAAPAEVPLGGFFLLDWHDGDEIAVERLPLDARVKSLYALEYAAIVGPADPEQILDLAAAPAWHVRRPTSWDAGERVLDRLLEVSAA